VTFLNARLVQAAAVAAGLTTLQHVALRDRPLPREARYALGVAAIWSGLLVATRDRHTHAAMLAAVAGAALPPTLGYARRRAWLRARRPAWLAAQ
jgi:hypothetical protein